MKAFVAVFLLILAGCLRISAQECYRVMFYNVENLFDTSDDALTQDEEFTPCGKKHWTKDRYVDKLRSLARVVDSVGGGEWPLMVGMAEVENRRVLGDLTRKTRLVRGKYGIVHQDSPDGRGIDVALLYRKDCMEILSEEFLRVAFPEDTTIKTRDILYAKGGALGVDTLHIFVCHFPSMRGGEKQSEWKRERAAAVVRAKVDSLFRINRDAAVVIMGDLNGKANTPAHRILCPQAGSRDFHSGELYNPGYYLLNASHGSYRYRGQWQTIDHILVSGSLLNGKSSLRATPKTEVYSASFLLEEDKKYFGFKPFPTYKGPRYTGGFSDHLPVYIGIGRR